jgi:NADH:ubiquinone oxidoreductase subunit F (NADH-binding)
MSGQLVIEAGPLLLAHVHEDPALAAHRSRLGPPARPGLAGLLAVAEQVALRGRGGAGFPFAVKLRAAASRRRPLVVVNAAEGEPASAKDTVLMVRSPHLVLDGAAAAAHALGTRQAHVIVPSSRPQLLAAVSRALAERRAAGEGLNWRVHQAQDRFVAGQARAVLELMAGRENLPVTAWQPEAFAGLGGRPTLLSNAETFAHVAALARLGPDAYAEHGGPGTPGTVLLTVDGDGPAPTVLELAGGAPLVQALAGRWTPGCPVLLGGYHGTWLAGADVARARLDRSELAVCGFALGAGVVLALPPGECPVQRTAAVVRYLAGESAGRCGPCRFGLPALADELDRLARGTGSLGRIRELAGLVTGRGACAHPDGTARLVASLLAAFGEEVAQHESGSCRWLSGALVGVAR